MRFKLKITHTGKDSDDVRFIDTDGSEKGFGYQKDNRIGLIRCPACERENYMLNVSTGICTWCGFNANTDHSEVISVG